MISVIVPVYNVEKYLKQCVDSIVAQTYTDMEIILVDDGSTDSCPQICDAYAVTDTRIRVLHKKNGGLSDARNAGLEVARGEFIGFVDSDDYIMPKMYEILSQACMEHEAEIAMCGRCVIDETDKMIRYECCMENTVLLDAKDAVKSLLLNDNRCDSAVWDKLYRSFLFAGMRYPDKVHYEDQNVTARLIHGAGKMYHVGQALYVYRKRRGSITSSDFNEHCIDELKQAELLKEFVDDQYPELRKESQQFVSYKMGFPLFTASRCRNHEMKEHMRIVMECGRRYFSSILYGPFTMKHKIWCLRNYLVLRLRLLLWG